jgi:hypothetical protein
MSNAYSNREELNKLKESDPEQYENILEVILSNHFSKVEDWPQRKMFMYEYWLRLDKVTRVLPPQCKWSFDIESDALNWAKVIMHNKSYEVDRINEDGSVVTIFVSDKSQAILNGFQFNLF